MKKWVAVPFSAKIEKMTALGAPFSSKLQFLVDFGWKLGFQDSYVLGFCWEGCCNPLFHRFFIDFLSKNWCFLFVFQIFLVFFWTWRPSRNIDIYISKATFSFLFFHHFKETNAPKSRSKNASKKVSKNVVPGTPRGPQNHRKMDQGRPKVCPKSKKRSIFERLFF